MKKTNRMQFLIVLVFFMIYSSSTASFSDDNLLTPEGSGLKQDSDELIDVEVITERSFDPLNNAANMKILKNNIDNYSKLEGFKFSSDNFSSFIINHGGKLAVLFKIDDTHCDKVRRFIEAAKRNSTEISYAILTCFNTSSIVI